jgi:DNA-directed RNA polymerase specialized sigma24 family protein
VRIKVSRRAALAARDCFLRLFPDVRRAIRFAFRFHLPEAREEAVQEAIAHAYWFVVLLARRNRLDLAYPTILGKYAIAHVRSGRRFTGGDERSDVLSIRAQRVHGFGLHRLDHRPRDGSFWRDMVAGNRRTSVPDQVAFAIDFPRWLATLPRRSRAIVRRLVNGDRTGEVARRFGLSPGRVSQLRRELAESWEHFHEPPEAAAA